jgi:DNA-binding LytR/AlgR family response regulator
VPKKVPLVPWSLNNKESPIGFLTDSTDFAVEVFSVKALHYLIKPLTEAGL